MKPTNVWRQSQQNVITNKPGLTAYSRNVENKRDAKQDCFLRTKWLKCYLPIRINA